MIVRTFTFMLLGIFLFPDRNAYAQIASSEKNEDLIIWSEGRQLDYSDFNEIEKRGTLAAESHLGFNMSIQPKADGSYRFSVIAYFDRNSSVMSVFKEEILNHEQTHFDIAELFARKMRKKIELLLTSGYHKETLNKAMKALYDQYDRMQESYDSETRHSVDQRAQLLWDERIAKLLLELKAYHKTDYRFPEQ